ncbi:DUF2975 domain-containing protein [Rhodobacteraceae bacterium NNCM2]|nr:DUF2975 domain-containing protein [Coraliihabitans acroporae]
MKTGSDQNRIVLLSRAARWATFALMAAIPVAIVAVWLVNPEVLTERFHSPKGPPITNQQIALCIGLSLIPAAIFCAGLWHLGRLFQLFAEGAHFSARTAHHLRQFAAGLLGSALAAPFASAAISVALSWFNPPGERMLAFDISHYGVGAVLMAALLFVLAWVMAEAQKLAEDQKLII